MRGAKPKPTQLKIIEGNPGKRPLNKHEPEPPKEIPSCPQWLDQDAKKEWRRVAKDLYDMGLLTRVDRTALAGYCEAYSRWKRAAEALKDGFSYEYVNHQFQTKKDTKPEVQIVRDALNQVRQFCAEFGLTPSSRGRMIVLGGNESKDPIDELLETSRKY